MKEQFYIEACNEYLKRLRPMADVEVIEIPEEVSKPDGLHIEAQKILAQIPKQAYVCAMCIEGKAKPSEAFAAHITDIQNRGYSQMVIIIGSSNGLDDSVKQRADLKLSMSPMTFPHHLARVMVLEQVYRAISINNGTKYHK